MKLVLTTAGICGSAAVLWAIGAPGAAVSAISRASPAPRAVEAVSDAAPAPSDADRRRALNARMQEMLRSGEGARLADPRRPRQSRPSPPRSAAAAEAPRRSATANASTPAPRADVSTIAPPEYRPDAPRARSTGRGYTPPRLDLRTAPRIPTSDIECLTQAIYYEARNESEEGQAAVAEVVINRSRSGNYPRDICQVVYQRNSRTCQFTFTCDGAIGRSPVDLVRWARAERIARDVYDGRSSALLPRSSVNYHANYVSPSWSRRLERIRQIGAHIFYGASRGGDRTPGAVTTVAPPPSRGLLFVRNAVLDEAFERVRANAQTANAAQTPEPARP